MLVAINYFAVFLYGLFIMIFLLNIKICSKNILVLSIYSIVSGIAILVIYQNFGMKFIVQLYPLIIHIPMVILFVTYFKKKILPVLFVLGTAYVLTSPRKWGGDLVGLIFNNNQDVSWISQITISIPLLIIIYKYLRPAVIKIIEYSGMKIILLTLIPLIYYVVAYFTTVYSDILYRSNAVVVGFLASGITYVFYAFLVTYFNEISKTFILQNEQNIYKVQVEAAKMQLDQIRDSQSKSAIYRHDLRHHLSLLDGYIKNDKIATARDYISTINRSINKTEILQFCKNDTVNLILSFYISKANEKQINVIHDIFVPDELHIDSTDVCVLLSNGLENAINATLQITNISERIIKINCNLKNNKLFIEIVNPFIGKISYKDNYPYNDEDDHGIGTKSIIAACEKYDGIYSFETDNNIFTLRVII